MAKFGSVRFGQYDSDAELLDNGFSIDRTTRGMGDDTDDGAECPECGVEIHGPDDVTTHQDEGIIVCNKCGGIVMTLSGRDSTPTDDDINRQEWGEAFGEVFDPEAEGDFDYEYGD
jgi:hypothetical protein